MIAKISVWAPNRSILLQKSALILNDTVMFGPANNLQFLMKILRNPEFTRGNTTTRFISEHFDSLKATKTVPMEYLLVPVHLFHIFIRRKNCKVWGDISSGWRNVKYRAQQDKYMVNQGEEIVIEYSYEDRQLLFNLKAEKETKGKAELIKIEVDKSKILLLIWQIWWLECSA